MSKATDLATKCFVFADSAMGLRILNEHELESFYHAARAEALREAADWFDSMEGMTETGRDAVAAESLRIMANSEGKE